MKIRLSESPLIEAVQYQGTEESANEIQDLIGNKGIVNFDEKSKYRFEILSRRGAAMRHQIVMPGQFVVNNNGEITIELYDNMYNMMSEYSSTTEKKEEENSMTNLFNGMFGKVAPGMCRISVNGDIAIKTGSGYKTYDVKTGTLTNCDNFVFDMGEEMFFIIPTNKVHIGDIILAGGKPRCVTGVSGNKIETLSFEDGQISTIVPEHHVFMGKQYFYGKIVSMFGNAVKGKGGMGKMMKYMMLSEVMKGKNFGGEGASWMQMLPVMALFNGGDSFNFDNMFDFGEDEDDEVEDTTTEEEEK